MNRTQLSIALSAVALYVVGCATTSPATKPTPAPHHAATHGSKAAPHPTRAEALACIQREGHLANPAEIASATFDAKSHSWTFTTKTHYYYGVTATNFSGPVRIGHD